MEKWVGWLAKNLAVR